VVAKHADYSNFGGDPEAWRHKRDVLRGHCKEVGRDPDQIGMTWSGEIHIRDSEADLESSVKRGGAWGADPEAWTANNLVGTAEQVCEKLQRYVDLGLAGVVVWCADYPDGETLERFARDVVPNFR
jgi:alkanesulfonate monooxygenase SsuD/methylene tetrahydromethanopterin reductase-like flavin-dependent oxidoreductase (luciferase family)